MNAVVPFLLDDVYDFGFKEFAFTPEECKKIIAHGLSLDLQKSALSYNENKNYNEKVRKSKQATIFNSPETEWIFKKLGAYVLNFNSQFFKFDLYGFIEGLQFTEYKEGGDHFSTHVDRASGAYVRKLSISLQLSEANAYEGGDLVIEISQPGTLVPRSQGCLIMFPSFIPHKVTPVTKGTRYSLVAWITGKPFV